MSIAEQRKLETKIQNINSRYSIRAAMNHIRQNHLLRLIVNDEWQSVWCVYCGIVVVTGGDGPVRDFCRVMTDRGIQFEVVLNSNCHH